MKVTLLSLFAIFITGLLYGQTNLRFCREVNKDGTCKNPANEFSISAEGGTITFLLKNKEGLGTSKVLYKIFSLSDDGKETYNNTIEQDVQAGWNYAWEEAVFYDPGTYKVLVYDKSEDGTLISTGILKIFNQ